MKYHKIKKYKYKSDELEVYSVDMIASRIETPFIDIIDGQIFVKKGYTWDGPSGPTFDTKTFMRGSLIHDALYQLIREGHLSPVWRDYADRIIKKICLEDNMNKFRAWYVYYFLKRFASGSIKSEIIEI